MTSNQSAYEPNAALADAGWRPRRRPRTDRLGVAVLVAFLAYLVVMPLVRLQLTALQDGGRGYARAFTAPRFLETLQLTVLLAMGSLLIALVLGTLLAWAASRLPSRLQFLSLFPLLPIVVPSVASVVGWAFLLSPQPGYLNAAFRQLPWWSDLARGPVNIYSMPWIIIITGIALTGFVYAFVSSGFSNINAEHVEAARVSGSSSFGAFVRVILPLLRPSLVYGGGVALLLGLGQFTAPLLLGRNAGINVITTDIYGYMSRAPVQYGEAAALASPLLVFGVLVITLQNYLLGNQTRFVTHGGKAFKSEGESSVLAAVGIALYGLITVVLPISAIVVVSLSPFWTGSPDVATFTLDEFRDIFSRRSSRSAIINSITLSLSATLLTLPIGFIVSRVIRTKQFGLQARFLDWIITAPLGIPAVVFGAGFLMTYINPPIVLYGTRWVIVIVYITLMLPFSVRMQSSAMMSIGDAYLEAARVHGSTPLGANVRILLPLMRTHLAGASALMFVLLTHEFAASLLVRSPRTQVMGTLLFDYWGHGGYPKVAAVALVMTVVTAFGVAVALMIGGGKSIRSL